MSEVLLIGGGLDSTAVAAWKRPRMLLFIDYGQRPAKGEERAAIAVSSELGLALTIIRIDCGPIGSGLLAGENSLEVAPTPEWWPFRNQLLITIAASWALINGFNRVMTGTVSSDHHRHFDGSIEFYENLSKLVASQEGGIELSTPAIHLGTQELIDASGVTRGVLGWTHSCHTASLACGGCPGCEKRRAILEAIDAK